MKIPSTHFVPVLLPGEIVELYEKASLHLRKLYSNGPRRDDLMAFSLARKDLHTILDEIGGWNEMSGELKRKCATPRRARKQ
jgi:hypothetical protein